MVQLVKFKDIHNPHDHNYNIFLRGKVAYLYDYRYIVPLEMGNPEERWKYEDHVKYGKPVWDTLTDKHITDYIDIAETSLLNNVTERERNAELKIWHARRIPIGDLKHFRTWLATALDVFVKKDEEAWHHVLQYYMQDMYDETIKWLSIFGDGEEKSLDPRSSKKGCGCAGDTPTASQSMLVCNSINSYKIGLYNTMVDRFGNAQFWASLPESFLRQFKAYIDGILGSGLVVNILPDQHVSVYATCDCGLKKTENNIYYRGILERLSASLNYIIHKDATGHLNFITKALREWASLLYEKMEW